MKIFTDSNTYKLKWSYDSVFSIRLKILNNTDTAIFVPQNAYAHAKEEMGTSEIGIEIKINNSNQDKYCTQLIQYLVLPKMINVSPGSIKNITVKLPGDCFVRKGKYKVRFFLKLPIFSKEKPSYKIYSSKRILIQFI